MNFDYQTTGMTQKTKTHVFKILNTTNTVEKTVNLNGFK
jgi:hypothetical protein